MLNIDTKSIIQSLNITWMNEAYHDWIEMNVSHKRDIEDEDHDVIANLKIQGVNIVQDNLRSSQDQGELKKKKVYRSMQLI
jgi:hypothetical protein